MAIANSSRNGAVEARGTRPIQGCRLCGDSGRCHRTPRAIAFVIRLVTMWELGDCVEGGLLRTWPSLCLKWVAGAEEGIRCISDASCRVAPVWLAAPRWIYTAGHVYNVSLCVGPLRLSVRETMAETWQRHGCEAQRHTKCGKGMRGAVQGARQHAGRWGATRMPRCPGIAVGQPPCSSSSSGWWGCLPLC